MGVNVIQLTSKSHHENILASLHQFRLLGQLSDFTVQVEDQGEIQEFQVHQVLLAASSGYFRKILLSQDDRQDKLVVSDTHFNDFSRFLEFVYTGKVEVARDKIGDVQAMAHFLDCEDLAQICGEAMSAGILHNPSKKTCTAKSVTKSDLHDAKKEKGTKGKRPTRSACLKRRLSPQRNEKQVVSKKKKTKTTQKEDKRPRRKRSRAQKEDFYTENQVCDENTEENESERGSGTEDALEKDFEASLEMATSDVDEWECAEDEQSNDPEDPSVLSPREGEEEEEEEEEEEDGGQSKKTFRTSKAQFQCNKCQRTFHYERSYLKHISTYHGVKVDVVYRCETCQQTFANRSNLKVHEKHVHSAERLFSCESCLKTFKRKKDVVRHQRQVHERSGLRHVCTECGKSLSSKTALLLHERTHTGVKPFECTDCGAKFTQNSALKMHRRTHTGEKPFACDECDSRFTQKHMLDYHKRSHTGEKPFMCEACGKSFASKEYLGHHSNIHTGSRPYKCDQCGRGFAQRNSLHQHLKIHTGERPYSCKDCDKHFTQLNALQRHQRIHTGEKPYMCGLCQRTFTDKSTLRRHTMIHDSDAPWKTYLVVLEGNVEDKKPKISVKGKTEKAGAGEKKSIARKSNGAAAVAAGPEAAGDAAANASAAGAAGDTASAAGDASAIADTLAKTQTVSVVVPAEPVTLPPEWTTHGAIALVSHSTVGGITVIHTEVPPGTQIQPILTTDSKGASAISLEGSAIPVPFSVPVSVTHTIPASSQASTMSLPIPTLSVPVSDGTLTTSSEIPAVSSSSVLEATASQTILAPDSGSKAATENGNVQSDIQMVVVGEDVPQKDVT